MKQALVAISFVLATSPCIGAQESGAVVGQAGSVTGSKPTAAFQIQWKPAPPVVGAPYSATITNQSVQTLADGNRIVQAFTGSTARDSEGRTRQDAMLPKLGSLSAANAPHLVFIQDPVNQTSYTLDLTNKTAQKISAPPAGDGAPGPNVSEPMGGAAMTAPAPAAGNKFFVQLQTVGPAPGPLPPAMAVGPLVVGEEASPATTEDLGSQTMEGVLVTGTRTTHTIPAGQIGNEQPLDIVTEVWFSPDLKTVVYSKRSDPRIGEQTFRLANIVRAEPDPSLFTVPPDFRVVDGPKPIIYRALQ